MEGYNQIIILQNKPYNIRKLFCKGCIQELKIESPTHILFGNKLDDELYSNVSSFLKQNNFDKLCRMYNEKKNMLFIKRLYVSNNSKYILECSNNYVDHLCFNHGRLSIDFLYIDCSECFKIYTNMMEILQMVRFTHHINSTNEDYTTIMDFTQHICDEQNYQNLLDFFEAKYDESLINKEFMVNEVVRHRKHISKL